jgi:hypothetical protein
MLFISRNKNMKMRLFTIFFILTLVGVLFPMSVFAQTATWPMSTDLSGTGSGNVTAESATFSMPSMAFTGTSTVVSASMVFFGSGTFGSSASSAFMAAASVTHADYYEQFSMATNEYHYFVPTSVSMYIGSSGSNASAIEVKYSTFGWDWYSLGTSTVISGTNISQSAGDYYKLFTLPLSMCCQSLYVRIYPYVTAATATTWENVLLNAQVQISGVELPWGTAISPTVSITAAPATTDTGITVTARVTSGNAEVTQSGLAWSTTRNGETIFSGSNYTTGGGTFSGTGKFTDTITGLKPSTTYYVKAYAKSAVSTAFSDEYKMITSYVQYYNCFSYDEDYNIVGTDVSSTASWGTATDGTGTHPSNFTTAHQLFYVVNDGATIGSAWTVSGTGSKVMLGDIEYSTQDLTIPSSAALTGTIDVAYGSTLTVQNSTAPTFGTLHATSTVVFDGVGVTAVARSYGNLTLANAAALPDGTVNIAGTFTPGTTTSATSGTVAFNGSGTQDIPSFSYYNLAINNTANFLGAVTINGLLSIATGATLNLGTYASTANTLSLGGVGQTAIGKWGSTASGATNINDTYFASSTGTVTVTTTVVPVELTSFTATGTRNGASLVWKTATETNNYGFDIERRAIESISQKANESLSGSTAQWLKVGFVAGNGTSSSAHSYSYTDASVSSGTCAYRLKQIDNSGTYKYSSEVEVTIGLPTSYALNQNYPNPFNPTTTIQYDLPVGTYGNTSIKVYDIIGREVATLVNETKEAGSYEVTFNASKLASGVYFYKLQSGTYTLVKKLVLMK